MNLTQNFTFPILFLFAATMCLLGQDKHYYQTDFTNQDFAGRRAKLFEKIGKNAFAVVQGAKGTGDFNVFR